MSFIHDRFILQSDTAERLFFDHAQSLPIIDYHNHLSPSDIATNRKFNNLTEAWLEGDHYKWRALRANGINESYITGNADPKAKFKRWAETVPYTIRNPLYHWTHLELKRYFGVSELLNADSAERIYDIANKQLSNVGAYDLMLESKVEVACTTDDPTDDLKHHKNIKDQNLKLKVFPTFRPDNALKLDSPKKYNIYLDKLAAASSIDIVDLDSLLDALSNRIDYFASFGCRVSDLGLHQIPFFKDEKLNLGQLFLKVRNEAKQLEEKEVEALQTFILVELGKLYAKYDWAQQLHLGALRNTNERALKELGPDTGYDSIGDYAQAESLAAYLNELNNSASLAKTIIYNLNPANNDVFAAMCGNFNDGSLAGKMQFGSGWWFLDQKKGMEDQINSLSNMGLLSRFIGMLTDSRSFLSFPRHEYFRRILCNLIANDVELGLIPNDAELLGKLIEGICYYNARDYFKFS